MAAAQTVVDRIAAAGGSAEALALDMADAAAVARAAAQVAARHSPLDVLVNNAGVMLSPGKNIVQVDRAELDASLATNSFGPWQMTLAFLPSLRRSVAARVVNVASAAGSIAETVNRNSPYAGFDMAPCRFSKAALNMLTAWTARALLAENIKLIRYIPAWCVPSWAEPRRRARRGRRPKWLGAWRPCRLMGRPAASSTSKARSPGEATH
jgi:NAD(P)-dependent dehydrogenase (short-subunit alcohol dehydrogenase family)